MDLGTTLEEVAGRRRFFIGLSILDCFIVVVLFASILLLANAWGFNAGAQWMYRLVSDQTYSNAYNFVLNTSGVNST